MSARTRWMELITGNLIPIPRSFLPNPDNCINLLPPVVDDLHICGRDIAIDGQGGVLGNAGTTYVRTPDPITGKQTTVTGVMNFDIADIPRLVQNGRWEAVILHEMGHVVGIGTSWRRNNVVDANNDYIGAAGINVWTNDWGCVSSAPPVEKDFGPGSRFVHWDEQCLRNEFMTPALSRTNPISRLTIGTVEDLGYEVDYDAADPYDGTDTTCCFTSSVVPDPVTHPKLSDDGRAAAVAYGLQLLRDNQLPDDIVVDVESSGVEYVGDRQVVVLYEEDGHIFDVPVTSEDMEPQLAATAEPSYVPTSVPTFAPTFVPTYVPTFVPTTEPTLLEEEENETI